MSAYATALLESPHKHVVEEALRQSDARAVAEAKVRALEAECEALRAEVARKDEALRELERIGPSVQVARIARAALGPWTPTHQHYKVGYYRELRRGIDAENWPRNGRPVVVYENHDGKCFVLPASVFDGGVTLYPSISDEIVPRYRPLTPAEQATYVEAAMTTHPDSDRRG
jgi:hypothetical protein